MKYIASRELEIVSNALNFSTQDYHFIGGCDLYTTKAAGGDKKLYKSIESTLETQHENLVRLSASLSPYQQPKDKVTRGSPHSVKEDYKIDLSRSSAFGSLHEISARRTFAYLIATLNATHPDYDFSNLLRTTDFVRSTGTHIRKTVDNTMLYLRPRRIISTPNKRGLSTSVPAYPAGEVMWGDHIWEHIDREMELHKCEKYIWQPETDPFEDDGSLWTQHYFFFNKEKKRVCYLHFGAYSVISHSPLSVAIRPSVSRNISSSEGAGKRAEYWLGHSLDDDDYAEGEYMDDLDDVRVRLEEGPYFYDDDDGEGMDFDSAAGWVNDKPRAVSEDVADVMEV